MKRRSPCPALLALAAVLALLGAAACGGAGGDSTDAGASQSSGATTSTTDAAPAPGPAAGHAIGDLAPDFTVETVTGETFALSEAAAAGSPVLLYFFTTW